jgi:hypothetical protein
MMSAYLCIIPGHGARPDGWDPGACAVRQTDTGPERMEEAALVRQMAALVLHHSMALGLSGGIHDAPAPCPDSHPLRHYRGRIAEGLRSAAARKVDRVVVLHLHLNAGGGRYGMTVTDPRSAGCARYGAAIDTELQRLAGITAPRAKPTTEIFPRAAGLIDAVWREGSSYPMMTVHALVCEPAFIDQPLHQPLLATSAPLNGPPVGLNALGAAIARGLALAVGR